MNWIYYRDCTNRGLMLCTWILMAPWRGMGYKTRKFRGKGRHWYKPVVDPNIPF